MTINKWLITDHKIAVKSISSNHFYKIDLSRNPMHRNWWIDRAMSGKMKRETTDVTDFNDKIESSAKTNSSAENLCRSCLSVTSAHGFPHLINNSKIGRIFWTSVMVITVVSCAFHLFTIFAAYLQYSFHMTVSIENTSPYFPYVTICDNAVLQRKFQVKETKAYKAFTKFERFIANHSETKGHKIKVTRKLKSVNTLLANLDENDKTEAGIPIESILVYCRYKGTKCSEDDFELYRDGYYLNCYTFKDINYSRVFPNIYSGLSLILKGETQNIKGYDVYSNNGNSGGFRVVIHEPESEPFLIEEGFDIIPGTSTSVQLSETRIERLGKPFAECKTGSTMRFSDAKRKYTHILCRQVCIIKQIVDKCGCFIHKSLSELMNRKNTTICTSINKNNFTETFNRILCEVNQYNAVLQKEAFSCNECQLPCVEHIYQGLNSYAIWPQISMMDEFVYAYIVSSKICSSPIKQSYYKMLQHFIRSTWPEKIQLEFQKCNYSSFITETIPKETRVTVSEAQEKWLRDSFYRLNIYFKETLVQYQRQIPSYSLADLWSDVGGVLGLWAGVSVVTVIETFHFLLSPKMTQHGLELN